MKKRFEKLVKLGVLTAIVMYFINKSIESYASLKNLLTSHEGTFYNWKNTRIFYKKAGSGSPILLIHDLYPTSSSQEWYKIMDQLSEHHTIYALDLPGCGRSDKPQITYTNYYYVLMLIDFIQNVVKEKCDIMSTGISGSFTLLAASIEPQLFGKLTLINPVSPAKLEKIPDTRSKVIKFLVDVPILGTSLYYLLTAENQVEEEFCEKYFYNPFHVDSKLMHTYYESAHRMEGNGRYLMASLHGNYVNNTIRFALPKLSNDIHLIFGKECSHVDNVAASYRSLNDSITCSFIEKTKMLTQLEAPEKLFNLI